MLKLTRAVPMSFPTIFFACLLLTTCAHAQSVTRLQHVELNANDPIKILQLLLENQKTTSYIPKSEAWVSKLADIMQNGASLDSAVEAPRTFGTPSRIAPAFSPVALIVTTSWLLSHGYFPAPRASSLLREMTPAQTFGIGAQSAH